MPSRIMLAPNYSLRDIFDYGAGTGFSIDSLLAKGPSTDLRSPEKFVIPVIIIQGADDIVTPTSVAKDYFASIDAPKKEFLELPSAGHFAFLTVPDKVLSELVAHVRPFSLATPN